VWGIWNQNIGINQLHETSRILCFAAKWWGDYDVMFASEHHDGRLNMLAQLYHLLDEADAVIHYNGKKFDMPHINREFLEEGYEPPDPYHQIDLMLTIKKRFRFVSNKLDFVCQELGLGKKVEHEGMSLWLKCIGMGSYTKAQRAKAWASMKEYNIQDAALLEDLYNRILPWIQDHPNHALYVESDRPICPNCGSAHVTKKGTETTKLMQYQRYRCKDCGTPIRGRTSVTPKEQRPNILTTSKL